MRTTAAEFGALLRSSDADDLAAARRREALDEQPEPRRGDGGECQRCHKALKWPADDGYGPVCRRIVAAEATEQQLDQGGEQ